MIAFHARVLALLPLLLASSALSQTLPHLFESDGPGPPNKLYWQTEPGVRYDLWKSDDLSEWQRVTGYPAVAEGLAMEHAITPSPGGKGFFKMIPIDEQAPVLTGSSPANGSFGVARFGRISIRLADATGIDPASIRLTVGTRGTFSIGSNELSYTDGLLTFDGGGDTALGAYGEKLTVSLQAFKVTDNLPLRDQRSTPSSRNFRPSDSTFKVTFKVTDNLPLWSWRTWRLGGETHFTRAFPCFPWLRDSGWLFTQPSGMSPDSIRSMRGRRRT